MMATVLHNLTFHIPYWFRGRYNDTIIPLIHVFHYFKHIKVLLARLNSLREWLQEIIFATIHAEIIIPIRIFKLYLEYFYEYRSILNHKFNI